MIEPEDLKILILSGSDRGKRIRVLANTILHRGPSEAHTIDEVRLFATNIGNAAARLTVYPGPRPEKIKHLVVPPRSELIAIRVVLDRDEILTAKADIKNIYVWGKALRQRMPAPGPLQRLAARLALWKIFLIGGRK